MSVTSRGTRPHDQTVVPIPHWALLACLPAITYFGTALLKRAEAHDLTAAEQKAGEQFIRATTAILDAMDAVDKEDNHVS